MQNRKVPQRNIKVSAKKIKDIKQSQIWKIKAEKCTGIWNSVGSAEKWRGWKNHWAGRMIDIIQSE